MVWLTQYVSTALPLAVVVTEAHDVVVEAAGRREPSLEPVPQRAGERRERREVGERWSDDAGQFREPREVPVIPRKPAVEFVELHWRPLFAVKAAGRIAVSTAAVMVVVVVRWWPAAAVMGGSGFWRRRQEKRSGAAQ